MFPLLEIIKNLSADTLVQDKSLDKKQTAGSNQLYGAEILLDLERFVCFDSFIQDCIKCDLFLRFAESVPETLIIGNNKLFYWKMKLFWTAMTINRLLSWARFFSGSNWNTHFLSIFDENSSLAWLLLARRWRGCCPNPKFEYRNPKQIQNLNNKMTKTNANLAMTGLIYFFGYYDSPLCFEFRYSDFGFFHTSVDTIAVTLDNKFSRRIFSFP